MKPGEVPPGSDAALAALEALEGRRTRLLEELADVEKQVYNLETSYLQDSAQHGNVLKGFEGFLGQAKQAKTNRARNFKTEDRLFSLSSVTSPAVGELAEEKLDERAAPAVQRSHKAGRGA